MEEELEGYAGGSDCGGQHVSWFSPLFRISARGCCSRCYYFITRSRTIDTHQLTDPSITTNRLGPSEFHPISFLATWDISNELHAIVDVPTLLINGVDEGASDESIRVFQRRIPGDVKWVKFQGSSHCPHVEEEERHRDVLLGFLRG